MSGRSSVPTPDDPPKMTSTQNQNPNQQQQKITIVPSGMGSKSDNSDTPMKTKTIPNTPITLNQGGGGDSTTDNRADEVEHDHDAVKGTENDPVRVPIAKTITRKASRGVGVEGGRKKRSKERFGELEEVEGLIGGGGDEEGILSTPSKTRNRKSFSTDVPPKSIVKQNNNPEHPVTPTNTNITSGEAPINAAPSSTITPSPSTKSNTNNISVTQSLQSKNKFDTLGEGENPFVTPVKKGTGRGKRVGGKKGDGGDNGNGVGGESWVKTVEPAEVKKNDQVNTVSFPSPIEEEEEVESSPTPFGPVPPFTPHQTPNRILSSVDAKKPRGRVGTPFPRENQLQPDTPGSDIGDKSTAATAGGALTPGERSMMNKSVDEVLEEGWQTTPGKTHPNRSGHRSQISNASLGDHDSGTINNKKVLTTPMTPTPTAKAPPSDWVFRNSIHYSSRNGGREEQPKLQENIKTHKERWIYEEPRERPDYDSSLFVAGFPFVGIPEEDYVYAINEHFRAFHRSAKTKIIRDTLSAQPQIFNAFVMFDSTEASNKVMRDPKAALFKTPVANQYHQKQSKVEIASLRIEKAHGHRTLWISRRGMTNPPADFNQLYPSLPRYLRPVVPFVTVENYLERFGHDKQGREKMRIRARVKIDPREVNGHDQRREIEKRAFNQELYGPPIKPIDMQGAKDEFELLKTLARKFGALESAKPCLDPRHRGFEFVYADRENALRACNQLRLIDGLCVNWAHELDQIPPLASAEDFYNDPTAKSPAPAHANVSFPGQPVRRAASVQFAPRYRGPNPHLQHSRSQPALPLVKTAPPKPSPPAEEYPPLPGQENRPPVVLPVVPETENQDQGSPGDQQPADKPKSPVLAAETAPDNSMPAKTQEDTGADRPGRPHRDHHRISRHSSASFSGRRRGKRLGSQASADNFQAIEPHNDGELNAAQQPEAGQQAVKIDQASPISTGTSVESAVKPKVLIPLATADLTSDAAAGTQTTMLVSGLNPERIGIKDMRNRYSEHGRIVGIAWEDLSMGSTSVTAIIQFTSKDATIRAVMAENGKLFEGCKQIARFKSAPEVEPPTSASPEDENPSPPRESLTPKRPTTPLTLPAAVHDLVPATSPLKLTRDEVRKLSDRLPNRVRSNSDSMVNGKAESPSSKSQNKQTLAEEVSKSNVEEPVRGPQTDGSTSMANAQCSSTSQSSPERLEPGGLAFAKLFKEMENNRLLHERTIQGFMSMLAGQAMVANILPVAAQPEARQILRQVPSQDKRTEILQPEAPSLLMLDQSIAPEPHVPAAPSISDQVLKKASETIDASSTAPIVSLKVDPVAANPSTGESIGTSAGRPAQAMGTGTVEPQIEAFRQPGYKQLESGAITLDRPGEFELAGHQSIAANVPQASEPSLSRTSVSAGGHDPVDRAIYRQHPNLYMESIPGRVATASPSQSSTSGQPNLPGSAVASLSRESGNFVNHLRYASHSSQGDLRATSPGTYQHFIQNPTMASSPYHLGPPPRSPRPHTQSTPASMGPPNVAPMRLPYVDLQHPAYPRPGDLATPPPEQLHHAASYPNFHEHNRNLQDLEQYQAYGRRDALDPPVNQPPMGFQMPFLHQQHGMLAGGMPHMAFPVQGQHHHAMLGNSPHNRPPPPPHSVMPSFGSPAPHLQGQSMINLSQPPPHMYRNNNQQKNSRMVRQQQQQQ